MKRKIIEMLAPARTDQAEYAAGEIYSVPAAVADRFVSEKVAKYIEVSLDEPNDDVEPETGSDSEKPWRETLRPGDIFQWQITLTLPHFERPRINPRFQPDSEGSGNTAGLDEVGGDGPKPSAAQEKAIDYLLQHEAALFAKVIETVAGYSQGFRADWQTQSPEIADQIVPDSMTPEQVAERISFALVYISPKSSAGTAYVQLSGECAWDPEHGFSVVLHQDRIVNVLQRGSGWSDP